MVSPLSHISHKTIPSRGGILQVHKLFDPRRNSPGKMSLYLLLMIYILKYIFNYCDMINYYNYCDCRSSLI